MTEIFEQNLNLLGKKQPELSKLLRNLPPNDTIQVLSKGSEPFKVRLGETTLSLDPPKDDAARREFFLEGNFEFAFILGLIRGDTTPYVHQTFRAKIVVIFEPEPALIRALFEHVDCSFFLSRPNVFLCSKATEALELLRTFYATETPIVILSHQKYSKLFLEPFQIAQNTIFRFIEKAESTLNKQQSRGEKRAQQSLISVPKLLSLPSVSTLQGKFDALPIIIAAPGPSLDSCFEHLRNIQDKIPILALNGAWISLARAGVIPHFFLATSDRDLTAGFAGLCMSNSTALLSCYAHPRFFEVPFFKSFAYYPKGQAFSRWLHGAFQLTSSIEGCYETSSGAIGLSLAMDLGFNPVSLIGFDHAFTDGEAASPTGLFRGPRVIVADSGDSQIQTVKFDMSPEAQKILDSLPLEERPDFSPRKAFLIRERTGNITTTTKELLTARGLLEDLIYLKANGCTVYDCNTRGLDILGTKPMALSDYISHELPKHRSMNRQLWNEILESTPPPFSSVDVKKVLSDEQLKVFQYELVGARLSKHAKAVAQQISDHKQLPDSEIRELQSLKSQVGDIISTNLLVTAFLEPSLIHIQRQFRIRQSRSDIEMLQCEVLQLQMIGQALVKVSGMIKKLLD